MARQHRTLNQAFFHPLSELRTQGQLDRPGHQRVANALYSAEVCAPRSAQPARFRLGAIDMQSGPLGTAEVEPRQYFVQFAPRLGDQCTG